MSDCTYSRISPELAKDAWPAHTAKRLSSAIRVTLATAQTYLRDGIPAVHGKKIATAIIADLDAMETEMAALRAEAERLRRSDL